MYSLVRILLYSLIFIQFSLLIIIIIIIIIII